MKSEIIEQTAIQSSRIADTWSMRRSDEIENTSIKSRQISKHVCWVADGKEIVGKGAVLYEKQTEPRTKARRIYRILKREIYEKQSKYGAQV
jgi:hypothetical protein